MKKAVIFDLDGTLTNTLQSLKYSGDTAFAEFGIGPFSIEQYKYFVGDGAANLVKRALLAGGDKELVHFEKALARYKEIFAEFCMYEVKPYDGIMELLSALKEKGLKIAVLSNKPHAEAVKVVGDLFGKDTFDLVCGQRENIAIKPSPEGVFDILKQFGIAPEQTLYLGDTGTDMKTGKSAGAFTVGVLWGFRKEDELVSNGADAVIEKPMEALSYIE